MNIQYRKIWLFYVTHRCCKWIDCSSLTSEDTICSWKQKEKFIQAPEVLGRNEGIWRRLVFFSQTSSGIVKVCSLMQCLFLASNSPCSSFMSLSNPSLGTLSSVTPGYGIWSPLLVPFLQSSCHLPIHPRGKKKPFISRCHNFWSCGADRPDVFAVIPYRWVCIHFCGCANLCMSDGELEEGGKGEARRCFSATASAFKDHQESLL